METEVDKQLYLTDNGFFLVTNEELDASAQERYEQMNYTEFLEISKKDSIIDEKLTMHLNSEFPPISLPLKSKNFKNNLAQIDNIIDTNNEYHIPVNIYPIKDNEIPSIIKQSGYTLDKDIRDVFVNFDEDGKISFFDKDGNLMPRNDIFISKGAFIEPQAMYIKFNIPRFILKKEDYEQYIKNQKNSPKRQEERKNVSSKEYSIINFVKEIKDKPQEILLSLMHESKHLEDEIRISHRQLCINAKKLSMEDAYKIEIEKERSTSFFEIITAINRYLETGNTDLLNVCRKKNMYLNLRLARKNTENVEKILSNYKQLFKETLEYWNTHLFPEYVNQCYQITTAKAASYIFLPQDKNHEEYMKQHSLLYTFHVYNPKTKNYETKDFSSLIDCEPQISKEIKNALAIYQNSIMQIQQDNKSGMTSLEKMARKMLIQKLKKTKLDVFSVTKEKENNILSLIKQRQFRRND